MNLVVSDLPNDHPPVELVERKGRGHPDSICDALAETLSRNLCRHYLERYGTILHHNVDKALLCGGSAAPAFGGGEILRPLEIYLSGRAAAAGEGKLPLDEIVVEGSRSWLAENLHALDPERHGRLHNVLRPASQALDHLFVRRGGRDSRTPLANDSSIAAGYAPMSALERFVLQADGLLTGRSPGGSRPAWGEDIKFLAIRRGATVSMTIACAMIGRYVADLDAYLAETAAIRHKVRDLAAECGFEECHIRVNAADDPSAGSLYLTVTGTSAEAGDDGQVGRGNRVNGLIAPSRPMSLEAAAGKNPVSHVGKIYNVLARTIAESIVSDLPEVAAAQCYLASAIGSPVSEPAIVHVRLTTRDGSPAGRLKPRIDQVVGHELLQTTQLVDRFLAGTIDLF